MQLDKEKLQNSVVSRSRISSVIDAWKGEWKNKTFRLKLLLTPGIFLAYSAITQPLSNYVELRKGVQLEDTLLTLLPSYNFSTAIFLLLYSSLIGILLFNIDKPKIVLRVIEMHLLVAIVRQICILLVALEPPHGILMLHDVFLENTVYPRHSPLTKDLFFSGHVASIWIYFLCAQKKYMKMYLLAAVFLMAFMVLSMRIHYSYDVYGAIVFTTLIYFAPVWVRSYFLKVKEQLP